MIGRPALLVALVCALASAAAARTAPAWRVDKVASSIRFSSSLSGERFAGVFRRWDAEIRFDPADLAGSSVSATIDVASAATGDGDRDGALPTGPFFAAARFPRAVYSAHAFRALGPARYLAEGQLTLRGVTKPLALPFTLAIAGDTARMNATLALNRLAFGIGQNEWKSTEALPSAVTVAIAIVARRAP